MPTLAIIAALPRELASLSRDLRATRIHTTDGVELASAPSALLATAGMGADRVALAVQAALAHSPVDLLLSVGLAGACDPQLSPGSLLLASLVIDARSGERFTPDASLGIATPGILAPSGILAPPGILVTSPQIAGPAEKLRLRATYNAVAVDMEAAAVARIARAHGIPFAALKAISDEHSVDLTHLSRFADIRGQFRTGAFALHTALRPRLWRPTAALGRNTSRALSALTAAIHQVMEVIAGS